MNHKQESSLINQFSQLPSSQSTKKVSVDVDNSTVFHASSEVSALSKTDFLENTDKLFEENKTLRADLNEKNKMIKNLQQRLNDMKKALKKELNSQAEMQLPADKIKEKNLLHNSASTNSLRSNASSTNSQTLKASFSTMPKSSHLLNYTHSSNEANNLSSLHEDVNFKYLKHVVFKFLCSREYEVTKKN